MILEMSFRNLAIHSQLRRVHAGKYNIPKSAVKAFDGSELLLSILFSSVLRHKVTYCKPTPFFSDSFKKMPPMLRGLDD
jgi:hypothetical protein